MAPTADPALADMQVYHYTGVDKTTYIAWAPFTFSSHYCNDGTIPFPTCYTGAVDADFTTGWSFDQWTDQQVPKWVISTEDETLHGETFTLTVSSNYDGYVTNTQTILLTIYGECEDQSFISVTVPTLTEKISYALGAPA